MSRLHFCLKGLEIFFVKFKNHNAKKIIKQPQSNFASIQCKIAIKVTQISNFLKVRVQSLVIATLLGAEGPQQGPQGPNGPEGPPALCRSQKDGRLAPRSSSQSILQQLMVKYKQIPISKYFTQIYLTMYFKGHGFSIDFQCSKCDQNLECSPHTNKSPSYSSNSIIQSIFSVIDSVLKIQ